MTDDIERLAALERRIARLEDALRARNSREQMPAATPRFGDTPWSPTPKRDWEALIGRYGTLVLAATTALAGVGTFIGWAINHGLLGPTQRVVLSLVAAAALGTWGFWLRQRERSYSASIIGLALAFVHAAAWGAGPSLHLVPTTWVFALAAAASLALEVFAHRENDEPLWSVGFFGAAIAPFVTADGGGSLPLLTTYGVGVLVSGGYALGDRPWRVAGRLFLISASLYVIALMTGREADLGPMLAVLFPIAVGYLGVLRWSAGWKRRLRVRGLGVIAAIASVRAGLAGGFGMTHLTQALSIGALGLGWLGLVVLTHNVATPEDAPPRSQAESGDFLDAGLLPLVFAGSAILGLSSGLLGDGGVLGVSALALLATHLAYPAGKLRDGAAFASVACAASSVGLLTHSMPVATMAGVAAVGAMSFAADRWKPSGWWTGSGLAVLAWSMLGTLGLMSEREPYAYAPFMTSASLAAAAVAASMAAAWRLARDPERKFLVAGGGLAWGFIWIHQEIASAFSRTTSTLLRVSYYAVTSVAAVALGRAKRVAPLRNAGLALAVLAAGTALYEASDLASVGARVFADLVAAGFLLAIAFWYRKPGARPDVPETTGPQRNLL